MRSNIQYRLPIIIFMIILGLSVQGEVQAQIGAVPLDNQTIYPPNNNPNGESRIINLKYLLVNNTIIPNQYAWFTRLPVGFSQNLDVPGACRYPDYPLAARGTCLAVLSVDLSRVRAQSFRQQICVYPMMPPCDTCDRAFCLLLQPITVTPVPSSTLSVQSSGNTNPNAFTVPVMIPNQVPEVTPVSITVTSGNNTAYNVHAVLPPALESIVTVQYFEDCTILGAGRTCRMTLTSRLPFLPVTSGISIVGDNIPESITNISLASSMYGYPVFDLQGAVSPRYVRVLRDQNSNNGSVAWDSNGDGAITTSATSLTNGNYLVPASRSTDVNGNSYKVRQAIPGTGLATNACYNITLDNSRPGGPALTQGTWYLPSICEMSEGAAGCNTANTIRSLVQQGFMTLSGQYWSSTEDLTQDTHTAWLQDFSGEGIQQKANKGQARAVRCTRAFAY